MDTGVEDNLIKEAQQTERERGTSGNHFSIHRAKVGRGNTP